MNKHIASVHEEIKNSNVTFVTTGSLKKGIWIDMLHQFMKKKGNSNAISVTTDVVKIVSWIHMLHQFLKGRSHSNVKYVTTVSLKKGDMNKYVASVHEGKKPFKCDICDYSCF